MPGGHGHYVEVWASSSSIPIDSKRGPFLVCHYGFLGFNVTGTG